MRDEQAVGGKTMVITGASSGVGRGTAVRAAAAGARVVLVSRGEVRVGELAEEIRRDGGQAIAVAADVTSVAALDEVAHRAEAAFGGIDVWVNNAAVGALGLFSTVPLGDHLRAPRDIRVTEVMPWALDTPWWHHASNYTRRSPRMLLLDDPRDAVDSVIRACASPRARHPVGWKVRLALASARAFPAMTTRAAALIMRDQLRRAGPADISSGSLHAPEREHDSIDGGVRERMRHEDGRAAS